jgi:hypothetical protein
VHHLANNGQSKEVCSDNIHHEPRKVPTSNIEQPTATKTKYLGLHLDQRFTWRKHMQTKRKQLDMKFRQMSWLLNRKCKLSMANKITLYKAILKPIRYYGLQLWGCAKPSTINLIQRFQSKTLSAIAATPWYVSNHTLHNDLKITFVKNEILRVAVR